MNALSHWTLDYDGWILLTGILCAVSAALPGCFLVLRRMSLLGDAISHAILPGLVAAFLISGSRAGVVMFFGAAAIGVLTALFTEWVRRFGRVDEGAAMGVVFTTFFALGLVGIVQAADHVDLDPGCVLYGALELMPLDRLNVAGFAIPRVTMILAGVLVVNATFVRLLYKELQISAFDASLAASAGLRPMLLHLLLMAVTAVTAVASFEAVGNILVVAMFVVPPATAYLLTSRLSTMLVVSVLVALLSAVTGDFAAIVVPPMLGFGGTSSAGLIALAAGMFFLAAVFFAPDQGLLTRWRRQRQLSRRIVSEDVIALLYRLQETSPGRAALIESLLSVVTAKPAELRRALQAEIRSGLVEADGEGFRLTAAGLARGAELVRSHRLWEHYLASEGHVAIERLHGQAESLEHFTSRDLRERLHEQSAATETDPHGRPIPDAK